MKHTISKFNDNRFLHPASLSNTTRKENSTSNSETQSFIDGSTRQVVQKVSISKMVRSREDEESLQGKIGFQRKVESVDSTRQYSLQSSPPVIQMLRGEILQQEGGISEIYLYDSDNDESYGLSGSELAKVGVGDEVEYRILSDGNHAEVIRVVQIPVSEIILSAAKGLGINDKIMLSLLMDFSLDEVKRASLIRGQIGKYLKDWKSFTACYNTASSLFQQLMSGPVVINNGNSIAVTRDALIGAIRINSFPGAIFKIKCGIHGFCIMVRSGNVELLQSFAGDSGEMLATSLVAAKVWRVEEAITLLTDMVDENETVRNAAQNTLFGGLITADQWPNAPFSWEMSTIKSAEQIASDVAATLGIKLKILKS